MEVRIEMNGNPFRRIVVFGLLLVTVAFILAAVQTSATTPDGQTTVAGALRILGSDASNGTISPSTKELLDTTSGAIVPGFLKALIGGIVGVLAASLIPKGSGNTKVLVFFITGGATLLFLVIA